MKLNEKGFTIIEMVVTVAILSILVMIAAPNFSIWTANQGLRSDVIDIEGNIQIARMTAINRNTAVTIRFNAPAVNQYIIFVDDGAGAGTARDLIQNGTEETIVQMALAEGVSFSTVNVAGNGILFNGRGLRGRPVADPANLVVANTDGTQYQIFVTMVGDVNANKL